MRQLCSEADKLQSQNEEMSRYFKMSHTFSKQIGSEDEEKEFDE